MQAIIWTAYGPPDVLQLREVEKPAPKEDEILIKVQAATVTAGDCEMRSLKVPLGLSLPMRLYAGFRRPERILIIGQEMAGEIEAVGRRVMRFKEGDAVFAALGFGSGAYAEYLCLPEKSGESLLANKPPNLTYEEAAALPIGGLEAAYYLRKADIRNGQKVLINGAGGSIGTFGVQLAKSFGAEVTAVDSAGKLDMLRSIGADQVIDYAHEDFTRSGQQYDVIFDVVGKSPFSRSLRTLNNGGSYLIANPRISDFLRGPLTSLASRKSVIAGVANHKPEDLLYIKELAEAGTVKPVIDRRFPLEQVAEAHRYVESGQKMGNVVITVTH